MKRLLLILVIPAALAVSMVCAPARAQFAESQLPSGPLHYDGQPAQVIGGPAGVASIVMPTKSGGGVIDISPAFADWLQPYVQAVTNALLAAALGYALTWLRTHWNINLDDKQRAALTIALQNQAGSLIADGKVKISGGKVDVHSEALATAATDLMKSVPAAALHFGLTPDFVAARIVDSIPQIAAGAAMIAQHAAAPAPPVILNPVVIPAAAPQPPSPNDLP